MCRAILAFSFFFCGIVSLIQLTCSDPYICTTGLTTCCQRTDSNYKVMWLAPLTITGRCMRLVLRLHTANITANFLQEQPLLSAKQREPTHFNIFFCSILNICCEIKQAYILITGTFESIAVQPAISAAAALFYFIFFFCVCFQFPQNVQPTYHINVQIGLSFFQGLQP